MTSSFPIDEYRNLDDQRYNTCKKDEFYLYIAKDGKEPVGFITAWKFNNFTYVEHFAVHQSVRGKGFGSAIIDKLKEQEQRIVLEVEIPDNVTAQRRVEFYIKNEFSLCNKEYTQPAYRPQGNELPMHLMFYGDFNIDTEYNEIKKILYCNVYGKPL